MNKIFIWGTGKIATRVYYAIDYNKCCVIGAIDSNIEKQGGIFGRNTTIYSPDILKYSEFDYVYVLVKKYDDIVATCVNSLGIDRKRIICFCDESDSRREMFIHEKLEKYRKEKELEIYKINLEIENAPYEFGVEKTPHVRSMYELLVRLIREKKSVCRFGDGELELMRNCARPWFQEVNQELSNRLREIFNSDGDNPLIALSNNFGNLSMYTESAAFGIRNYLYSVGRDAITGDIDFNREYYDAYVSRPYLMFKDKNVAQIVFDLFKELWNGRNVLIVEGEFMRTGMGNNLFENVASLRRIICPAQNAFNKYQEIKETILENARADDLVLICLGPTATVLAYDICRCGIQAIDLGQIDNEYEWYLMGADDRVAIQGKAVPELEGYHEAVSCVDLEYNSQIIRKLLGD